MSTTIANPLNGSSGPHKWSSRPFTQLFKDLHDRALAVGGTSALAVYVALCRIHSDARPEEKDSFRAGKARVARHSGCSTRTVVRVLPLLEAEGLIAICSGLRKAGQKENEENRITLLGMDTLPPRGGNSMSLGGDNEVANNVPVLNIISQSLNPSVLIIPAYTLSVGRLYDIQLTVTISSSLQSSKSIVQVYVQSGSLVPRIKGGSIFNIRFGDSSTLDGSQSFDENTNSAAYLIFRWTCIEASPDYLQNCSRLFQNSNSWDHDFLSLKSVAIPYL
jgi:hypothetical protein